MVLAIMSIACTESVVINNKDVPCVGIDAEERDPKYLYKLSGWNIAMGVIFFEVIIPPIIVIADELYCPYRERFTEK